MVAILHKEGIQCRIRWLLAGEGSAPKIDSTDSEKKLIIFHKKFYDYSIWSQMTQKIIYHEIDSFLSHFSQRYLFDYR